MKDILEVYVFIAFVFFLIFANESIPAEEAAIKAIAWPYLIIVYLGDDETIQNDITILDENF